MIMALACLSESTNSCSNTVHMKTVPTSVLKVLNWVFATSTKICASNRLGSCLRTPFDAITWSSYSWMHYLNDLAISSLFSSLALSRLDEFLAFMAEYRPLALVQSIFRADWFGRWVVTHSLADSNFHGHRPAVFINQHLLWLRMSK